MKCQMYVCIAESRCGKPRFLDLQMQGRVYGFDCSYVMYQVMDLVSYMTRLCMPDPHHLDEFT